MGLGTSAAPRDTGEMPNTPALGHRILHRGHCRAELPQSLHGGAGLAAGQGTGQLVAALQSTASPPSG